MPTAICTTCRKTFSWHNRRGTKLRETPSPCCGALARNMTKEERAAYWEELREQWARERGRAKDESHED